ncbi:hypothetical protein FQA39_LY12258 [Lamprigera yunnana]|nr:hypothetical protein FQA39_LY12258 [Lamprigera yunnana]
MSCLYSGLSTLYYVNHWNVQLVSCFLVRHTMKLVVLVIMSVFHLDNLALIAPTKQRDSVRRCMKQIIDVYGDGATTILSFYQDKTKGNFLPHPMQIPMININMNQKVHKLNYQPCNELVIIDAVNMKIDVLNNMDIWSDKHYLKRKYVFIWPTDAYNHENEAFRYLWQFDILDAVVLVYDYNSISDFTEMVISNRFHPLNKCGSVVTNMTRFSCDMIKKDRKQKFFRNYNKCTLIYLFNALFQYAKNEQNYITEFVLSQIVATLNLTFSKKHRNTAITKGDHYVLWTSWLRVCVIEVEQTVLSETEMELDLPPEVNELKTSSEETIGIEPVRQYPGKIIKPKSYKDYILYKTECEDLESVEYPVLVD